MLAPTTFLHACSVLQCSLAVCSSASLSLNFHFHSVSFWSYHINLCIYKSLLFYFLFFWKLLHPMSGAHDFILYGVPMTRCVKCVLKELLPMCYDYWRGRSLPSKNYRAVLSVVYKVAFFLWKCLKYLKIYVPSKMLMVQTCEKV